MALPALPLPTGGATHVLEVVTMLLAVELIGGLRRIWLPARWCRFELATPARQKLFHVLVRRIRWLERFSRPRATWVFDHRLGQRLLGLLVLAHELIHAAVADHAVPVFVDVQEACDHACASHKE
jgi:hypothetical protein